MEDGFVESAEVNIKENAMTEEKKIKRVSDWEKEYDYF